MASSHTLGGGALVLEYVSKLLETRRVKWRSQALLRHAGKVRGEHKGKDDDA